MLPLGSVYLQTAGVSSLALALLTLRPSALLSVPPLPALHRLLGVDATSAAETTTTASAELLQMQHLAGAFLLGVAGPCLLSLWHEQYEFFYMMVPVRLAVSTTTLLTYVLCPERVGGLLAAAAVFDVLGAGSLGLKLGFTGRAPTEQQRRTKGD